MIATLCFLLIASNLYWMYSNQLLINKLMSRNYHEYVQATATPEPSQPALDLSPDEDMGSISDVI